MSGSEYHVFSTDGTLRASKEMRNGHGSVPPIWSAIWERHGTPGTPGGYMFGMDKMWSKADEYPPLDAFLFKCSFDVVVIPRSEWPRLKEAIATITEEEWPANAVNHWPEVFTWLQQFEDDETVLGFGIRPTSISEDPWYRMVYPTCPHCEQDIEDEGDWKLIDVLAQRRVRYGVAGLTKEGGA